jgi:hypothetical protein
MREAEREGDRRIGSARVKVWSPDACADFVPARLTNQICARAQVPYAELKGYIKKMQSRKYERDMQARRTKTLTDACAICLEPLGLRAGVTTTACKHSFHTFCLIETLGNGVCTSCPLCRTEIDKLMPDGLDGQSLRLMSTLRISRDEAQSCHKAMFDEIASKAALCRSDIQALKVRRYIPFTDAKLKKIRPRLQALLDQLEVLRELSRFNVEGFSRICREIDVKMSSGLSKLVLVKYVHDMGYYKDFAEDGDGLATELGHELYRMVEMVGGLSRGDAAVSTGCSGVLLGFQRPAQQYRVK